MDRLQADAVRLQQSGRSLSWRMVKVWDVESVGRGACTCTGWTFWCCMVHVQGVVRECSHGLVNHNDDGDGDITITV